MTTLPLSAALCLPAGQWNGLVTRADRRAAQATAIKAHNQPRDHIPVYLSQRNTQTAVISLSPTCQSQARPALFQAPTNTSSRAHEHTLHDTVAKMPENQMKWRILSTTTGSSNVLETPRHPDFHLNHSS